MATSEKHLRHNRVEVIEFAKKQIQTSSTGNFSLSPLQQALGAQGSGDEAVQKAISPISNRVLKPVWPVPKAIFLIS